MNNIDEIVRSRHSVRKYKSDAIEMAKIKELELLIKKCNEESKLNIQLFLNDRKAFEKYKLHYGKIYNCANYITLIGNKHLKN